ncbi:MAG: ABC transporter ATP-binding protein [Eubacteriales bacterium]|nr:ABC transporter ATP-binding protein [Eubacteriales bacterium]
METILRVENLVKNGIINGVSFKVSKGEMVAVMGPSGSGKSTLLINISGMDNPDSGRVIINGMEITALSEDDKAAFRLREMGFVFQQMNMMENLSIIDNIMLPAVEANRGRKGKTKTEIRNEAKELMMKLSIDGLGERRISEVSGGQLQRACICRSLMNSPKIVFADEPTGALNKAASNEVMETLVSLNEDGTTILMVTHDSRMASRCGRILYLEDGQIKGEFNMEKELNARQREEAVNEWLTGMEW